MRIDVRVNDTRRARLRSSSSPVLLDELSERFIVIVAALTVTKSAGHRMNDFIVERTRVESRVCHRLSNVRFARKRRRSIRLQKAAHGLATMGRPFI